MGESKIEWTDMTWNPVTGCTKVSTGCKHCYAERLFPRVYGKDTVVDEIWGMKPFKRKREFTDVKLHPDRLEQPLHWKKPRMIFVNSMSDLFHEDIPFEFIDQIFAVMARSEQHTFQILTKRPHRMLEYIALYRTEWNPDYDFEMMLREVTMQHDGNEDLLCADSEWPLKNVWLGISCENQATADERIPILLQVPAAVRFLSCEPLLASIDLNQIWAKMPSVGKSLYNVISNKSVDWVIVGGESGPGYRPMKPEWAKSIIEHCQAARVPVFMKQMAGKKWIPEDLKIREYPKWD